MAEKKTTKVQARLKWEAACERLAFVLEPPPGVSEADTPLDLDQAVRMAQAALEEVRVAFGLEAPDSGPKA